MQKRDKHLLQEKFCNFEKFPKIAFKGTQINKKDELYWVKGALSMVGITRTIKIPFQFNNNRAAGSLNLNRKILKLDRFLRL